MDSKSLIILLICICSALLGCQKTKINPTGDKKGNISLVDTTLITGHWKLTSKPSNYYSLYIKTDHNLKQDNTGVWDVDLDYFWAMLSDSSVNLGGQTAIIKKLDKDSLILRIDKIIFRHIRDPLPVSAYTLSTVATNLQTPGGITGDVAGNIYYCESFGERITMISAATKNRSVVAGFPFASFSTPILGYIGRNKSITMDYDGSIVACGEFPQISRISFADQKITKLGGKGKGLGKDDIPALESDIDNPWDVKLDAQGNIYFCELSYSRVRKINKTTGIITTVVSKLNAAALPGMISHVNPSSIAFDKGGNLYVTDLGNHAIWKCNLTNGNIELIAGNGKKGFSGDGANAIAAMLSEPNGISLDAQDNIYFADTGNNRIRKISNKTSTITTIAGRGVAGFDNWTNPLMAKLSIPGYTYVDLEGNVFFTDVRNSALRKLILKK